MNVEQNKGQIAYLDGFAVFSFYLHVSFDADVWWVLPNLTQPV